MGPIAQADELFDFPPFISVLLSFHRSIIGFAEGLFWVSYDLRYYVQRFCHRATFLSLGACSLINASKDAVGNPQFITASGISL